MIFISELVNEFLSYCGLEMKMKIQRIRDSINFLERREFDSVRSLLQVSNIR